jgi:hypothetical protein
MNNYSFTTSLPAYQDNALIKRRQADDLFLFIKRGANNLLQLSQLSGLPQSTVAGRCNDLLSEGKIKYAGHVIFADRKRKKICVIKPVAVLQNELF